MTENWTEVRKEVIGQPVSIKLERGQKGNYGWEIKVYAETMTEVLLMIEHADSHLRRMYGGEKNEEQKA